MTSDYHAPRHGTKRRYQKGCRCTDCTEANRAKMAAYRQRRRDKMRTDPSELLAERPLGRPR